MATYSASGSRSGAVASGSAVVEFSTDDTSVNSNVEVCWDFDDDGNYDEDIEDITDRVLSLQTQIGRDYPSQLDGRVSAGVLRMLVDNSDDAFSQLNPSSPMLATPNTLRVGQLVTVRESGAAEEQPTLLARDRFTTVGALTTDEVGNQWTRSALTTVQAQVTDYGVMELNEREDVDYSIYLIDVGTDECLTTATFGPTDPGQQLFLFYAYTDEANHGRITITVDNVSSYLALEDVTSSVPTAVFGPIPVELRDEFSISVWVSGSTARVYLDSMIISTSTAYGGGGTKSGLGSSRTSPQRNATVYEFGCWDRPTWSNSNRTPTVFEPYLWTGRVADIRTKLLQDGSKVAEIDAYGPLARLAQVSMPAPSSVGEVISGYYSHFGQITSAGIGFCARKAGLYEPHSTSGIVAGDYVGAIPAGSARGMTHCRELEAVDGGLLFESETGIITYHPRAVVGSRKSRASWGDSGSAQFTFETIELIDLNRERPNRVEAGVSPSAPSNIFQWSLSAGTAAGVNNAVVITTPSVADGAEVGMLAIAIISSSVWADSEQWIVPPGWSDLTPRGDDVHIRVYAIKLTSSDIDQSFTVYADGSNHGGSWTWTMLMIDKWWGEVSSGVSVATVALGAPTTLAEARSGDVDPPAVVLSSDVPHLVIAARGGQIVTSLSAGSLEPETSVGDTKTPNGYSNRFGDYRAGVSSAVYDCALEVAYRTVATSVEQPSVWPTLMRGFDHLQAVTIAVAGFDGSPPGSGREVVANDLVEQRIHGVITAPDRPEHCVDEAGAQALVDARLAKYQSKGKPRLRVSFHPNNNAAYRYQAQHTKMQDVITVVLDGQSGITYTGDFVVERITNRFDEGARSWLCIWELSPK